MKKIVGTFLLMASASAFASDLPEPMLKSLSVAKERFVSYASKTPEEMLNRRNSDAEVALLSSFGNGEIFGTIYGKKAMIQYRFETMKDIAEVFSNEQLKVLPLVALQVAPLFTNSDQIAERNASYFGLAQQWKENSLSQPDALKKLSKKPFSP